MSYYSSPKQIGEKKIMAKWESPVDGTVGKAEEGAHFMMRSRLGTSRKEFDPFLHLFSTKANHYFPIQHPSFLENQAKQFWK